MSKTIAIITALSLGLVACGSPNSASTGDPNASAAAADVMASDTAPAAAAPTLPAEPESKWTYGETTDEMKGTTTRHATITSDNEMEFDFPYAGGSSLDIRIMKGPSTSVLVHLEKGQLLCNSFSHTKVDVKFDNGPVRSFRCVETNDGDSSFMFLEPEQSFISAMRKSKKMIIQPCIYQQGCPVYRFSPEGLKGF